jgi:predicted porin
MKKSLLALAALSAFATAAQAQSSVSVYGIMDMSYGENKVSGNPTDSNTNKAKNTKVTGLADDAVNSSRIGFRGVEDIGGGVKAGFVVEANLDMVRGTTFDKANQTTETTANKTGTAFLGSTRQTMLSLSDAKLGTLGVGYKKTLETDFNDLYFTGTENSAGNQSHVAGRATRANGIYYTSPAFSGVTVSAQVVSGEATNESAASADIAKTYDASMTQFGVNYAAGALQVGAVYFNGSLKDNSAAATLLTDVATADSYFKTGDNDYKGYGIGANYNFGFAKVTAQMGERKYGLAADQKKNEYTTLGVTFPVGKLDLMAAYSMQEIKLNGVKQDETDGYQLIARYNLSKRTNVYALVGENKKEVPTAGVADVKTSVARIGVAHSF